MAERSDRASDHASDRQLLLYADGELSARAAARVRAHLVDCSECRALMGRIATASAGVASAQRIPDEMIADIWGPRALLKTRLHELAHGSFRGRMGQLRPGRNFAYLCALILFVVVAASLWRQSRIRSDASFGMLPNPGFTPGSTRQASLAELCTADHDEVVRDVPETLRERVLQEYGIRNRPATDYEVDYLITPGLGGADDVSNLWPEPHSNTIWNSYVKDQLEDHLHRMVCDGRLNLSEAQRDIASNWIVAYKKYFHTERPLANPSYAQIAEMARAGALVH